MFKCFISCGFWAEPVDRPQSIFALLVDRCVPTCTPHESWMIGRPIDRSTVLVELSDFIGRPVGRPTIPNGQEMTVGSRLTGLADLCFEPNSYFLFWPI